MYLFGATHWRPALFFDPQIDSGSGSGEDPERRGEERTRLRYPTTPKMQFTYFEGLLSFMSFYRTLKLTNDKAPSRILQLGPPVLEMAPGIPEETQCVGQLIALEGNINTITTQLRLLPHSHMILIVAPLDHYLGEDHQREPFEARVFVRDVYIALTQRIEIARSFLRSSPQSRLVFLNGGSISARAMCVAKISQRLTYGNFAEAEAIFHDIVKDGVAALFENTKSLQPSLFLEPTKTTVRPRTKLPERLDLRSTNSAQTLDVKDQPEYESIVEENAIPRARGLRRSRDSRTTAPEPWACELQQGGDIVTTVLSIPPRPRPINQIDGIDTRSRPISQYSGTFGPQPPSSSKPSFKVPRSRCSIQQTTDIDGNEDHFEYTSQDEESSFSAPRAVYGEACIVDMQSALPTPTTPVRWMKSVGDLLLGDNTDDSNKFKHSASVNDLGDSFKVSRRNSVRDSTLERLPKAAFVKASKTTIRSFSTPSTPASGNSIRSKGVPRILKGCGTEFEEDFDSIRRAFDIAEDVIIYFTDNSPSEIVRSISEYKSGNFPISPLISPGPLPTPPDTAEGYVNQGKPRTRQDYQQRVEVDPFCSSGSTFHEEMKRQRASESVGASTNLPTLATSPLYRDPAEKFCEFSGASTNKAIDIQNKFRSFLTFRFPEEATVLNQYQNSLMPESGTFWRDMFSSGSSAFHEGPAIDQIIAVGCEKGISDFSCTQLLRQIESIGVKENGESRSGRLDLRFLIANAMQTFMSQPLLSRKDLDPMSDPKLLAELIVPHLEQYLATSSSVRFLVLSFPFDKISTVIALRSILGSNLVKVAGVLDTLSSDPPSFVKPPFPQFHASNHSYDTAVATSRPPEHSQRHPLKSSFYAFKSTNAETIFNRSSSSFSLFFRADYHLPSSASPPEVQNFLNLIRKNIVKKSPWYKVEQVGLQPFPIPSQRVIMKDASTCTDESLGMDSNIDISYLTVKQDQRRPSSSFYDSEASEVEILCSPRPLPTRLSPYPSNICMISRPLSPPPALISSSSCSLSDSTIRHIPIAFERPSIPQNLTPPSDEPFVQGQEQQQYPGSEYPYERSISSSTPAYLGRARSNISSGNIDLNPELEAEEDSEDDAYDRMVMGRYLPMGTRERSMSLKTKFGTGSQYLDTRGNSSKALKWLGLA
ncbi:hypothetical protein DSL72_006104 [Monilinia vaccinii-corymbosi]|uniref:Uncharacterized protein n=1 Tax=Monilinia vaccinii-corymbosi TaxID=61207 RepID=A0A8A3PHG6_9HELO|nr:hypothetical protein DSL72_006104 [Monilinia vaccinii-corymbosi]